MSLELNPFLMLLVFIVFLLLIFILNTWLYRPMLDFMQHRDRLLGENASDIEEQREEIQRIKVEIEEVLSNAQAEAKQIKEQAVKQAQILYDEKFTRAKAEIDLRYANALEGLQEKRKLIRKYLEESQDQLHMEVKNKFNSLGDLK